MFSFRTEGFSCSLGVLYGGLGVSKFKFLIQRKYQNFFSCKLFYLVGNVVEAGYGVQIPEHSQPDLYIKSIKIILIPRRLGHHKMEFQDPWDVFQAGYVESGIKTREK
jgi:hypothetical protein